MRQFGEYLGDLRSLGVDCRAIAMSSEIGFPPEMITTHKEALEFVNWKLKSLSLGVTYERRIRNK